VKADLKTIRHRFALPMLGKELVEQAARKRTYVTRTLYAALLFGIGALILYEELGSTINPLYMLGRGRELFLIIVALQFAGIYIFLPALMCGVIAQEREKDSLVLLLLTDLRPWELLFEKYLSRLLPMLYYLLLALPLMAVAYSFGGFSTNEIISAVLMTVVTCIQVGALSLAMSAYCRSVASAFIATYAVGAAIYLLPLLCVVALAILTHSTVNQIADEEFVLMFMPFFWFYKAGGDWAELILGMFASLLPAGIALLLARYWLVNRALVRPGNALLTVFKTLDRFFHRANRVTGGIVLYQSKETLPEDRPVAWWELTKRGVGKAHYLFRILTVFLLPVLFIIVSVIAFSRPGRTNQIEVLSGTLFVVWPLALLFMSAQSASVFATDRSRQTLDVLLTTPMAGRQILLEKTAALKRLAAILLVPVLLTIGTEVWWETWPWTSVGYGGEHNFIRATRYLSVALGMALISFPLVGWFSIWVGMYIRNQLRAIVTAIVLLLLWIAGWPFLVFFTGNVFFPHSHRFSEEVPMHLSLASPLLFVVFNEFDDLDQYDVPVWLNIIGNLCFWSFLWWFLRWQCLRNVDRLLGRVSESGGAVPVDTDLKSAAAGYNTGIS